MTHSSVTMTQPLHLTADEKKLFLALPEKIRKDWEVHEEKRTFTDSEKQFRLRWMSVRFESEKMRSLERKLAGAKSMSDMQKIVKSADLSQLSRQDVINVMFIAGPKLVGVMLFDYLVSAKKSDDLDAVARFSQTRSVLLDALLPA